MRIWPSPAPAAIIVGSTLLGAIAYIQDAKVGKLNRIVDMKGFYVESNDKWIVKYKYHSSFDCYRHKKQKNDYIK